MLVGLAAFVVVIGGLRVASPVLLPFLLSAFLAILSTPPMLWLERIGLPRALAIAVVFLGVVVAGRYVGLVVYSSANRFVGDLDNLEKRLEERSDQLVAWIEARGLELPVLSHHEEPSGAESAGTDPAPGEDPVSAEPAPTTGDSGGGPSGTTSKSGIDELLDFGGIFGIVRGLFQGLTTVLGKTFLIFLTVFFILLEVSSFPLKFNAVFPSTRESLALRRFTKSIRNYIAIKTATSLATGILIGVWLALCGIRFPVLWGLLAFLLNFIPNVGSILAAFPPALLALIDSGWKTMLVVVMAFLIVNTLIGSILEPRVMGRGLGISPLIVFASLVFWGWVFGPVGMFLSVPLTMTIKIALESNADTRWIAVFLGSEADAKQATPFAVPSTETPRRAR